MVNATNATTKQLTSALRLTPIWATLLSASFEIIICIGGLIGNVLFITAVLTRKKLRTYSNIFLINISVTDLIAIIFVSIQSADSYIQRGWRWGHVYCVIHNYLHASLLSISLWLTTFVAVNRYIYIVHKPRYQHVTNRATVILGLAFAWMLPIVLVCDDFIRKPSSTYVASAFRCISIPLAAPVFVVLFYVPSVIAVLSYIFIFIYVRRVRIRIKAHDRNNPNSTANKKDGPSSQELRMVVVTMAVFFLVTLGYMPFVLLLAAYQAMGKRAPPLYMVLLYPLLHVCGLMNPILYGATNRNFRAAYGELIKWKFLRGKTTVTPLGTVSAGTSNTVPSTTGRTQETSVN
ncbi:melatonin receptor type 1A-like [Glandiceps talaboti]